MLVVAGARPGGVEEGTAVIRWLAELSVISRPGCHEPAYTQTLSVKPLGSLIPRVALIHQQCSRPVARANVISVQRALPALTFTELLFIENDKPLIILTLFTDYKKKQ